MSNESTKPDLSALRIRRDDPPAYSGSTRSRRSWIWAIAAVIVVAAALVIGFQFGGSAIPVETATVQYLNPASAQSLLTATGYVVAQRKAEVASKGTGRLEVLNVEEGDWVTKGDIIAKLEADDVTAAREAARAAVAVAEAEVDRNKALEKEAKLAFDRAANLLSQKLISQAEFDNAEARYNSASASVAAAQAGLISARADLQYAEVQVENTIIRAPFDGTVLTKNADVGDVVAPFASSASSKGAVVTLADMSSLEVEADVSESNIEQITQGQRCVITLDAYPASPYNGYAKKIVPTADRTKATVMVKVAFDSLDERVLPEMSAKVSFLPTQDDSQMIDNRTVLSVPLSAITERDGQTVAFVVRQGRAHQVPVDTGTTYSGAVEIRRGLARGDVVVIYPAAELHDGSTVELGL
ncbi:MAG: efflux RND transporter periplasmic adaptor subunit [Candidatus Zixiibacteriota bacterium]